MTTSVSGGTLRERWPQIIRVVVHVGAWFPIIHMLFDGLTDNLTVNPIQEITHRTGWDALVLLTLSLVCTPAAGLLGWKWVLPLRRTLGLYAFMYAAIHLLIFAVLDFQLDITLIGLEITEKRYIIVGFAAFLLLLPLAITSTRGWMRRLGKNWKRLHRLVYIAAPLAVFHFAWLVKTDIRIPALFGVIVALLLALRLPFIRRSLATRRVRSRAGQPGT